MIRKPRNTGLLVIFFGFSQDLDEQRDTAAIDIGVFFKLQQYFADALI
jgi:hypothetical protein